MSLLNRCNSLRRPFLNTSVCPKILFYPFKLLKGYGSWEIKFACLRIQHNTPPPPPPFAPELSSQGAVRHNYITASSSSRGLFRKNATFQTIDEIFFMNFNVFLIVTEDEIRRGIITATEPEKHCFWFKRVITDLLQNAHDPNAGKFVDKPYGADNSAIDESAQRLLESLREKDLSAALQTKNVIQYDVKWTNEGISPEASSEHAQYLEKLCADVYNVLTGMIQEAINEKKGDAREDSLNEEILQHALFCQKKGLACQGRDDFLQSVKSSLLERNDKRTVILHGESGCGKTSVLAKMAVEVRNWLEDDSAFVVLRFIGTSPESSSIRLLLRSVCQQLCKITNNDATQIPEVSVYSMSLTYNHYKGIVIKKLAF